MAYYRFITEEELALIRRNQSLLPRGHYPPYELNQIVCVFESDDLPTLFEKYGETLAELREIPAGRKLIVVEVINFDGRMELDRSQAGWPESRAVLEPIPSEKLRKVAEAIVQSVRGGQAALGSLQFATETLSPPPANAHCCHPKRKIGILAFGSLIADPGTELLPKIIMRIKTTTPFGVEYGRYSQTRGGAPTLAPHEAGAPVDGEILVLEDTVSVEEAKNMLWRRERRKEGTGQNYVEGASPNSVLVREWADSPCVEHVLYTDFHPEGKVATPQPAELAKKAIQSVKAAKEGMDGITYLKNSLASGVKTKLTADYEAEILKQTETRSLKEAIMKTKTA